MYSPLRLLLALASGLVLFACGDEADPIVTEPRDRPLVVTTFYPMTWICDRLAGDAVELVSPLPDDADPIFWRPGDADLEVFVGADLIVANGAGFEHWMRTASLPESRLVLSAAALRDPLIEMKDAPIHSHGGKGEHSHTGIDGHTWVDPLNAIAQAEAIRDALVRLLPDRRNEIDTRMIALARDLQALNVELEEICADAARSKQPILASHPAYNYLARRFGLAMVNLDLDPEEVPDDGSIARIGELLKGHKARAILWESAPLPEVAEILARRLNLESFVFSPCEMMNREDQAKGENYLTVMKVNLGNLRSALALRPN